MTDRSIVEPVAIGVVLHICPHISLIVGYVYGGWTPVMRREMSPVPGGMPGRIRRPQQTGEYQRPGMIDRLDDEIRPIYVGRAYDLHAGVPVNRDFSHKSGDVLIDILR